MAYERLGKDEILSKFIIPFKYGTSGVFPYGAGASIVLYKVSCISYGGDSWSMIGIHRNKDHGVHAEMKLVELLENISQNAREIDIELIQNYSPCNDKANDGCAKIIVDYKEKMEYQGKKIYFSIMFANFYRTVVYYRNNENRADQNREGLQLLRKNGVQLQLLCGEDEWKKFLNDDQLVSLNDDDRKVCWEKAVSDMRKKREDFDMKHYEEILCTLDANDPRLSERFSNLRVSLSAARQNSMAHKPLGREEIQSKFIISRNYATPGLLPERAGTLVVLSQVSIYYSEDSLFTVAIHRNDTEQHAETKLLQLLKGICYNTRSINIEIIQNFSPCNDDHNDEFCAKGIVDYKNKMKRQGTKIDISVTFANFYRTVVYEGNDENRAQQNRKGLQLMYNNGVCLRLLCGQEEWRKFLNDDQLVSLSAEDWEECWNLALSAERHGWEKLYRSDFLEILKK